MEIKTKVFCEIPFTFEVIITLFPLTLFLFELSHIFLVFFQIHGLFFICTHVYTYMFLNITWSVSIMSLMCMFSGIGRPIVGIVDRQSRWGKDHETSALQ